MDAGMLFILYAVYSVFRNKMRNFVSMSSNVSYRLRIAAFVTVSVFLFAFLPLGAQKTVTNNVYEPTDTTSIDTVIADTLAEDGTADMDGEREQPWPQNVQWRIDRLLESDIFTTSTVGLEVYDLTADSVIYSYNARQLMRPASTLKMIVAVTALDRLGSSHKYVTSLHYKGDIDSTVLNGNIYCKGGFDPAFDNTDMDRFVNAVLQLGIDTIKGDIYADVTMKDKDRLGEGWCWDDDNPVLSPLLINRKDEFVQRFKAKLEKAGIFIDGTTKEGATPRGTHEICRRERRICDIMNRMMKRSDNLYAESMFYNLAVDAEPSRTVSARHGRQAINRLVSKFGMRPAHYYIADGSGLSLYNYVSPRLEVCFLRHAYRHKDIYDRLLPTMPVAGVDGTLAKRMRRGHATGNVKAKTGTVTGVSALAGYCTAANGHILCFSIINMGIRHASSGRNFQDRVCEALCRP